MTFEMCTTLFPSWRRSAE